MRERYEAQVEIQIMISSCSKMNMGYGEELYSRLY